MKLATLILPVSFSVFVQGANIPVNSEDPDVNSPLAIFDQLNEANWKWKWPWPFPGRKPEIDSESLQDLITIGALKSRADTLYKIAQKSVKEYGNPTRVIGSPGHWATLRYIFDTLNKHQDYYNLSKQDFDAVYGKVYNSSLEFDGVISKSASPFSLTPSTPNNESVSGKLIHIPNNGCDEIDFLAVADDLKGNVALIQRGICPFGNKTALAGKYGAITAIVYNNEDGDIHGTLGEPNKNQIATFGISHQEGVKLIAKLENAKTVKVKAYIRAVVGNISTFNIVAQTKKGDQDNCVALGSHSDSVGEGPGINDDGSGTISLLEVATHLTNFTVNNCVRFMWVAAEEEGLLGSTHYANHLTPEENQKIRVFMDYDMMASPNYAFQVYNATNSENPEGSEELRDLYIDYYTAHGYNHTLIPFDGRSDYVGFIENGIPGGGIATGAEGVKTKEEVSLFGGEAGQWYDPCYHQLCDDTTNIDDEAWIVNTKLIAHSVATFAKSFDGFPKRAIKGNGTEEIKSSSSVKDSLKFKYRGPKAIL